MSRGHRALLQAAVWLALQACETGAKQFTEVQTKPSENQDLPFQKWKPTCQGALVDSEGIRLGIPLLTIAGTPVGPGSQLALDAALTSATVQLRNIAGVDGGSLLLRHVRILSNGDAKGKPWLSCLDPSWGGDCQSPFRQLPAALDPGCTTNLPDQAEYALQFGPGTALPRTAEIEFAFDGCGPDYVALRVKLHQP